MYFRRNLVLGGVAVVVLIAALGLGYILGRSRAIPTTIASSTIATSSPSAEATTTTDQHLTEKSSLYSVDLIYPSNTSLTQTAGPQMNASALAAMKSYTQSLRDQFVQDGDFTDDSAKEFESDGGSFELSDQYRETTGPGTISYIFTVYEDSGGAHPNTYSKTFTFDAKSGQQLALSDLFISGSQYLQTLSTLSRASLTIGQAGETLDPSTVNDGTTPTAANFQDFTIDSQNLVILFDPYQVASYADGPQIVTIPLSQLSTMLKSAYK